MYLIDTNIFFELIFNRKNAVDCEKLFLQIQDKKIKAICSHFSIHSICVYLLNGKKAEKAKQFLKQIYSLENLEIIATTINEDIKIVELSEELGLDFDDSMQYYIAVQLGCDAIITFDKDFKKTKMKIFEPKEAIGWS